MRCRWALLFALFVVPLFAQIIEDSCHNFAELSGTIVDSCENVSCWRITPFMGKTKRATSINYRFIDFDMEDNFLILYTSNSPDSHYLKGNFTGQTNPSGDPPTFALANTDSLYLFNELYDYNCNFTFQWETNPDAELKTALVVLVSVIIMFIIPLISQ